MLGFNRPFCSTLPRNWRTQLDPRDPDYDDGPATAIADEAIEGSLCLKNCPGNLFRALADFLTDTPDQEDAIRELLLPLYAQKQSVFLRKLHAEFSRSEIAHDVAALAIEREYAE